MPITKQTIVRFGKYKGKKWDYVLKDESYCRWLIQGDWLNQETKSFLEEYYPCKYSGQCVGGRTYIAEGIWRPCEYCRPKGFKGWLN